MIEVGEFSCHITNELKTHWDKNTLKLMKKRNMDKVFIVDGGEGLGKSTWAFQQMAYLDPEAFETPEKFVSRIAFTADQFMHLVRTVKNGVIVFDEAFRGFSSRAALSKINKRLVQALMEMRQNNNIVFIVLPSIFLLDIYPAMLRSQGLFNIYADKRSGKRVWQGYNKQDKNAIYQVGIKKGWMYFKKSRLRGYFYSKFPIGPEYEKQYLKKKEEVFRMEDDYDKRNDKDRVHVAIVQRDKHIREQFVKQGLTVRKFTEWYNKEYDSDFSKSQLGEICVGLSKSARLVEKPMEMVAK